MNDSELLMYATEDGETKIEVKYKYETVWLTQIQISELFNEKEVL